MGDAHDFNNIGVIDFSYFPSQRGRTVRDNRNTQNPIRIKHDTTRNPAQMLPPAEYPEDKWVIVAMYAWDGNAYPGNEWWLGPAAWAQSGDPAAACCSAITILQNPNLNANLRMARAAVTWDESSKIIPISNRISWDPSHPAGDTDFECSFWAT